MLLFLGMDLLLIPAALLGAVLASHLPPGAPPRAEVLLAGVPWAVFLGGLIFAALGIPRIRLADFGAFALGRLFAAVTGLAVGLFALTALTLGPVPAGVHVLFGVLAFTMLTVARIVMLQVVVALYRRDEACCRVLIYGAGLTGMQLAQALRSQRDVDPVAFIDDNRALQGLKIAGLPVLHPSRIAEVASTRKIDRVVLAMPSLGPQKQARIARRMRRLDLEVRSLPSFSQLIDQQPLAERLRSTDWKMFLNRVEVPGDFGEGPQIYAGKVVLVTGAGGSIGAELCRQLILCRPSKIVLLEHSEYALFFR